MSSGHAENEHFTYDITSKLRTKFLGNSVDVYPVGRQVSWICQNFVLIFSNCFMGKNGIVDLSE
jgi:hypothetical protein